MVCESQINQSLTVFVVVFSLQVLHQGLWLHNIEAGSLVNSIEYESIHESQTGSYQVCIKSPSWLILRAWSHLHG